MPPGNPSPKLAITIAADVHEQVLVAAARRGVSVSAWMTALVAAERGLLGRSGTADVVDATVVTMAIATQAQIVTSDRGDLSRIANAARARLVIIEA